MKKIVMGVCLVVLFMFSNPLFGSYLLVNSFYSNHVLRYDMDTGNLIDEFIAVDDGGLTFPEDILIGPDGNLLISGPAWGIKKYDFNTGDYLGIFASFTGARKMAIGPDGDVYVSKESNGILRYDGMTGDYLGQFTSIPVSSHGMLFYNEYLYVADIYLNKVFRFDAQAGNLVDVIISDARLNHPEEIMVADDGLLYIANGYTDEILRYNANTGAFVDVFVTAGSGGLNEPQDMLFASDGYFYVSGYNSFAVHRYNGMTGAYIDTLATGIGFPTNMMIIPEPSVLLLLGAGGFLMAMRRKQHKS